MSTNVTLSGVAADLREQVVAHSESSGMPGHLAGVYHGGQQAVLAHGVANVVTEAPMREDTGFLFGSITKVLTTTLVLQQVERGAIDLEDRVIDHLPEFALAAPSAAREIRVRHLLTHTNGIDADLFLPDAAGREALTVYVRELGRRCGTLFAPTSSSSRSATTGGRCRCTTG